MHQTLCANFLDACVEKTRKLSVGNGMDPKTEVGPMIHEKQLKIVEGHVEDARARERRYWPEDRGCWRKGLTFMRRP